MSTKSIEWFVAHVIDSLGDHENPLGSNKTKYGVRFHWNGVSWCVIFGEEKYEDAGVTLPLRTASCVALYDKCVEVGLHYTSDHCVPGDAVIRTWQRLGRHSKGFDYAQTHFQIVVKVKTVKGVKYLGLVGGNQGAGYVGPAIEWIQAGDASILGGLAFHKLFTIKHAQTKVKVKPVPVPTPPAHDKPADLKLMPAAKSHKYPKVGDPANEGAKTLTKRIKGKAIRDHQARWRRLRNSITAAIKRGKKK